LKRPPAHSRRSNDPQQPSRFYTFCVIAFLVVGGAAFGIWKLVHRGNYSSITSNASDERAVLGAYSGSASCVACHQAAFNSWTNSHHGLAERLVQEQKERAAFEPSRTFKHGTQETSVQWNGGKATVTAGGLSGTQETYTVERVIGDEPLRQFLVPFPGGRLQTLEASYDPRLNDWFNVYGQEDRKAGEWGHWTGRGMNWNNMCAFCHNTQLRKNYAEATDTYRTTMAETGVTCEACHGPLKAHVEWQRAANRSGAKDPTVTKFDRRHIFETCGTCHARRAELTGDFKPGEQFDDHFELVTVDASDRFYPDGQVHDEDYEFGPFVGSRMHLSGVDCLDCHNPHTGKTILEGNALCMRCHSGGYTNAPRIDPETHSHHKVLSVSESSSERIKSGGECVNCHMPQTTYMQRHRRHDHGFTIPDPLLTRESGVPNACNRCHEDRTVDWAVETVNSWYGPAMVRPTRHRAEVLARARNGESTARDELIQLLAKEPIPYWRAAEVRLLERWAGDNVTQTFITGLEDTNALVRLACVQALEYVNRTGVDGLASALERRLQDPVRSVRIGAAWALRENLDTNALAGKEFLHSLEFNADQPTGQLQWSIYLTARNDLRVAVEHLKKAIAWDPYSPPFRHQLAVVLSQLNQPQAALEQLQEACRFSPRDAESHFKLGLAFNETGNLEKTIEQFKLAVQIDPHHARAWYNLGLAQNTVNQPDAAIESLLRAEAADSNDPRIPYARATILARLDQPTQARAAAGRALEIQPGYIEAKRFLEQLR
jgi:tetratricopeptide (TPR) repeat protein